MLFIIFLTYIFILQAPKRGGHLQYSNVLYVYLRKMSVTRKKKNDTCLYCSQCKNENSHWKMSLRPVYLQSVGVVYLWRVNLGPVSKKQRY